MRHVILYIAMSLDGYLADANGGVAWLDCDGIRLFSQQERELPLKLIAVERYNGMAELRYQRRKPLKAGVGD